MSQTTDLLSAIAQLTTVVSTLSDRVATLESRPARGASKSGVRTFATKDERLAGQGFACGCGRNDLRMPAGHIRKDGTVAWHNTPDGERCEGR